MSTVKPVKIYVQLLEEGTETYRPTSAVPLEGDTYRILPTPTYDPEDEIWQYPPDSIVRCELTRFDNGEYALLAIARL